MSFIWSKFQESAFSKAKYLITSAPVLAYCDLHMPVVLQTDTSDYALDGALLKWKAATRRSPTEQRYSRIEKECLAICICFQKFDRWLYGKSGITVHIDHQPLETIMKKPLNKAPARQQRMLMRLHRCRFNLTYKKRPTIHLADTLSFSPSTANISKSNTVTLRRLPNGDGVRAEQQKPKAGREHREPPT